MAENETSDWAPLKLDTEKAWSSESWTPQLDALMASWCDQAKCFEYMHNESYTYNVGCAKQMTLFITILTAVSGTANIAAGGASIGGFSVAWIFGGLTIMTSIATMLQDKFAYAQIAEGHKRFAATWGCLRRKIEAELILPYASRKNCEAFMKLIRADIDQVSADGNSKISKIIRQNCLEQFKSIPDFDVPDICGQVEHTKIYVGLQEPLL
jgi:hypothetical protein